MDASNVISLLKASSSPVLAVLAATVNVLAKLAVPVPDDWLNVKVRGLLLAAEMEADQSPIPDNFIPPSPVVLKVKPLL